MPSPVSVHCSGGRHNQASTVTSQKRQGRNTKERERWIYYSKGSEQPDKKTTKNIHVFCVTDDRNINNWKQLQTNLRYCSTAETTVRVLLRLLKNYIVACHTLRGVYRGFKRDCSKIKHTHTLSLSCCWRRPWWDWTQEQKYPKFVLHKLFATTLMAEMLIVLDSMT